MDVETAQWLVSLEAAPYIAEAHGFDDPSSLASASALRRQLSPDHAAAVADLESLRRKATTKLGDIAHSLFLTHDGLEQATRFEVARWRAKRIRAMAASVIDAGCGLGIDALAARMAGMEVTGIEIDPVTAILARANLGTIDGPEYEVRTGAIENMDPAGRESGCFGPETPDSRPAVFLDPARRTPQGRSWNVNDMSPSWDVVLDVLHRYPGPVVVKLAPGFPHPLLPDNVDITWVSHHRTLLETTLWSYPGASRKREAVVLNTGESRLLAGPPPPAPGLVDGYILEPDPAVIRSGAIGALARMTGTHPLARSIAYLSGPEPVPTDFATCFEVLDILDYSVKRLKTWVKEHDIGVLEIKQRGLDIDPAALRRTLKLSGNQSATVIASPTILGAQIFVVRRIL